MTQPPSWAVDVPSTPGVHPSGTQNTQFTRPFTQAQLQQIGQQLIEQFLAVVVKAIVGIFIPGGTGSAFTQLQSWATGGGGIGIPLFGPLWSMFGGATNSTQATNFVTNLLSLFGGPTLTGSPGSFNPSTVLTSWITGSINPLNLLVKFSDWQGLLTGALDGINPTSSGGILIAIRDRLNGLVLGSEPVWPYSFPITFAAQTPAGKFFTNLRSFLFSDFTSGTFNRSTAAQSFITNILNPTGVLQVPGTGITSSISDTLVPGLGQTLDDAWNAIMGLADSGVGHTNMKSAMAQQADALSGTAAIVAQMKAAAGTGNRDSEDFEFTQNPLSTGWLVLTRGGSGTTKTDGHNAVMTASGLSSYDVVCRRTTMAAAGDDMETSMVFNTTPAALGANGHNRLWLRMSPFTTVGTINGVYLDYRGDGQFTLVNVVNNVETVLNGPVASAFKAANGSTWSFKCVGRVYTATMNGTPAYSFPETGTAVQIGSGFRNRGFGGKSESVLISFDPGQLKQWTATG